MCVGFFSSLLALRQCCGCRAAGHTIHSLFSVYITVHPDFFFFLPKLKCLCQALQLALASLATGYNGVGAVMFNNARAAIFMHELPLRRTAAVYSTHKYI